MTEEQTKKMLEIQYAQLTMLQGIYTVLEA